MDGAWKSILQEIKCDLIKEKIYFSFSQKDLENLKAEVQRRQQLQELGKSEEPAEDSPLELEDKIPID